MMGLTNERLRVIKDFGIPEIFQNVTAEHPVYHEVLYEGTCIAYVCSELEPNLICPHIHVLIKYRTSEYLSYISDVFHKEYITDVQEHGYTTLVTSCDIDDKGTAGFLEKIGFNLKPTLVGVYNLT